MLNVATNSATNSIYLMPAPVAESNVLSLAAGNNQYYTNMFSDSTFYMPSIGQQEDALVRVVFEGTGSVTIATGGLYPVISKTTNVLDQTKPTEVFFSHPYNATSWYYYILQ
jgi:hypothetical protein